MKNFYFLLIPLTTFSSFGTKAQDVANFTFTVNAANKVVQFKNTSVSSGSGDRKAVWEFGDGKRQITAVAAGVEHQYNTAGTYTVCLKLYKYTNRDSVLSSQECKKVVIESTSSPAACKADFEYRDSAFTHIAGHRVNFVLKAEHSANKPITQVCWKFGDGKDTCVSTTAASIPQSLLSVSHHYPQHGTYNVCVRVQYADGCVAEKCNSVSLQTVADKCELDYKTEPITNSGLSQKFIAQPGHNKQKKPLRICWRFGDGKEKCVTYATTFNGSYAVDYTYANAGQYEVCATVLYDGGCEAKKCKTVSVSAPPVTAVCEAKVFEAAGSGALQRSFYVTTMSGRRAERICWTYGDGKDTCINLPNPVTESSLKTTHLYPAPGTYRVCARVLYAGGCVAESCREVVIRSGSANICGGYMTDSFAALQTVVFKGFGIQNANDHVIAYRWAFGDGTTGTGQQVKHTYEKAGSYNVCLQLVTDRGCETRICKRLTVAGQNEPALHLSPNPAENLLHIVFRSSLAERISVFIFNANGVLVRSYQRNVVAGQNSWDVDVSTLPKGVYSFIIRSNNQLANAIFTKQ